MLTPPVIPPSGAPREKSAIAFRPMPMPHVPKAMEPLDAIILPVSRRHFRNCSAVQQHLATFRPGMMLDGLLRWARGHRRARRLASLRAEETPPPPRSRCRACRAASGKQAPGAGARSPRRAMRHLSALATWRRRAALSFGRALPCGTRGASTGAHTYSREGCAQMIIIYAAEGDERAPPPRLS